MTVAGFSMEKVHDLLKKSPPNGIKLAVRDRWVIICFSLPAVFMELNHSRDNSNHTLALDLVSL